MKNNLIFVLMLSLIVSCVKDNTSKESYESLIDSFGIIYKIKTIKGTDNSTKKDAEFQIYESVKGEQFLNQVKEFYNTEIDSASSRFYNLTLKKNKKENLEGTIDLFIEREKFQEIEFKVIATTNESKDTTLSFKSYNSKSVDFNFAIKDSTHPIKGVLCIKVKAEVISNGKTEKGYYKEYMFVDNEELTDNKFIKKYKKYK